MFEASQLSGYSCGANANYLIQKWFGDCIYTTWDTAAFWIGLSSVFFWIIAQLPQFISNFLRSAADALSPWFLAQWLAGDTFNFLGCVLTGDQLKTQIITAGYFIFSDVVIIMQYVYYQIRNRNMVDFDESTHKGSAYSHVLKSYPTKDSALHKLIDQSVYFRAREGYEADVNQLLQSNGQNNLRGHPSTFLSDGTNLHDHGVSDSVTGATDSCNGPPKRMGRAFESSGGMCPRQILFPSAISGSEQQDSWMYEHRHRLRRLVQEYGLDYGNATAKRLTSLYNIKHKEKYNIGHSRSSKRAYENLACMNKACFKAVLGITGLLGLISTSKLQHPSNVIEVDGVTYGRRSLLTLQDTGARLTNKSMLMEVGQTTAVHFADQPSLFGHQAYSWTSAIGTCLGWGSSALYLGSRLSQLFKNKQRQSTDGLSLGMVMCAVLANLTYGTSIVMQGPSWDNLVGKAPWLAGSFGTVFLDFSILIQANCYSRHRKKGVPNEYTPLLASELDGCSNKPVCNQNSSLVY